MPTETQAEKLKKQENEWDPFCMVSAAFRLVARRSAIAQLVDVEDFSDQEPKKREKQFQSMRKRAEDNGRLFRYAESTNRAEKAH